MSETSTQADAATVRGSATSARRRQLRQMALSLLARREYTRAELERKLLQRASRHLQPSDGGREGDTDTDNDTPRTQLLAQIHEVLDELGQRGLQSDTRTADVLVQSRAARWGSRRFAVELDRRGLDPEQAAQTLSGLAATEHDRARELWTRKFGDAPADASERARQMRFLAARGFPLDVVRRVINSGPTQPEDE